MDYSARQKNFQQTLAAERLDGFVVTHPANLRYLCGYSGSNGLLLFLNRRKTFFTDGRYTQQARGEVKGARIVISGRLGGADMSRIEQIKKGRIPLQTFRANIDYASERAYLPYGTIGIKVWIYGGDERGQDAKSIAK